MGRVGAVVRALVAGTAALLVLLLGGGAAVAHQLTGACGAQTDPAAGITVTGATLNGELGALSGSDPNNCGSWFFDYGKTIAYGSTTSPVPVQEGDELVSAPVTGLAPNTTYHFRLETTTGDFNVGSDMTFTTMQATSCGAATGSATNVTPTSVTLNGTLGSNSDSDAAACGTWHFEDGPTTAYGSSTPAQPAGSGQSVPVSATVGGLTPNTTYHFRLVATSGTANTGSDMTVTTAPATSCGAGSDAANEVTQTSATLHGRLGTGAASDAAACGTWHFDYGTTSAYGSSTAATPAGAGQLVGVASMVSGLTPGTTYHFRVAGSSGTENLGSDLTFTTAAPDPSPAPADTPAPAPAPSPPAVTTPPATTPTTPEPPPPPNDILINQSIGPIAIGMTEAEVVAELGEPLSTLELTLGDGKKGRFARYRSHGGWLLITYDATGHVASIEAYASFYATPGGLGPGSPISAAAALRGFRPNFCEPGVWNGTAQTAPTDVVTVFSANGGLIASVTITELRLYTACYAGATELPPPPEPKTIVLGRSIGGVSIGMTRMDVLELLGSPTGTLSLSLGGGRKGLFARYRSHGKPLLVTFDSSGRVVSIQAYAAFFRTKNGLGPGAPFTLVQQLPGFRPDYCELGYWSGTVRTRPNDVVTVFTPNGGLVDSILIAQLRLYTACAGGSLELPPSA